MELPETRYAELDGAQIAFQVFGSGSPDVVFMSGLASAIDFQPNDPGWMRLYERLSSFSRLIVFDRRGTGSSDPIRLENLSSWEHWAEDLTAVLKAAGSVSAVLCAAIDSGPWALLFAATNPDRTSGLVLWNSFANTIADDDYPFGVSPEDSAAIVETVRSLWGTEEFTRLMEPTAAADPAVRAFHGRWQRLSCTPVSAAAQSQYASAFDVRSALSVINAPTLVLHNDNEYISSVHGRYIAEHVAGAQFVTIPGKGMGLWSSEALDLAIDRIEEFITGVAPSRDPQRVLCTVMFTDIVASTDHAARLGDRAWTALLDRHDAAIERELLRFRGRRVNTTGDGILAIFDGPARGVRCAQAITTATRELGLDVRVGLHAGEVEHRGGGVSGIAVHIGQRISSLAGPGEILVSRTVADLVAGSSLQFEDRGEHRLKGVPNEWRVYAVTDTGV